MRAWTKMTNDELILHLDMWLAFGDVNLNKHQEDFFKEVIFRLQLTETRSDDGSSR